MLVLRCSLGVLLFISTQKYLIIALVVHEHEYDNEHIIIVRL